MIVIVAGGRDYVERRGDMPWLMRLADLYKISAVDIHEGGATGADELGRRLKQALGGDPDFQSHRVPTWAWVMIGRGAGPMRNEFMVKHCDARAAIIFPGGRGTADLERRARAAGLRIFKPYGMEAVP